jgi:hypothetical protein
MAPYHYTLGVMIFFDNQGNAVGKLVFLKG